jgi:integrase
MRPLTPEQVRTLFTSTHGNDLHALWVLLCTTGLRIGEATGLEWRHVDLAAGVATIQQTVQWQQGKGLVLVEPKTGRSRRSVHLAPRTVETLRHHQDRQKLAWRAAGRLWNDEVLVFCTRSGRPLAENNLRRSLHRSLKKAGLPIVRIHDLRHTAAPYLLSLGTHPKMVQELLGHSSILLTLDTYSHVLPAMHQEIAARMDKLFEVARRETGGDEPVDEPPAVTVLANRSSHGAGSQAPLEESRDDLPSVLPSNAQNRR